ncbi:MAG: ADP-heptose--LPS heptosyltransferase [Phycisphaerae bacterium]|jgi:ADP-heptose:LPS heptosyltransferase|nr:MAG: ADP-heptose--LPS heptosyltransferase [Phycisphaerae bacterium]
MTDSSLTIIIPLVAGIGNALMTEPMIRQLRQNLPQAKILVMAINSPIAEVAKRIGQIDVVVTGGGTVRLLQAATYARKCRPDFYIVPFPSNRWQYNALARAVGANRVIIHDYPVGKWSALGFLHPRRVPSVRGIHDVEQNLRLLPELGIQPLYPDAPRFPLNKQDREMIHRILEKSGINGDFVVLHAGSAKTILAEAKRWPEQNYARLARSIRDETGLNVLVVEGPDEQGISQSIYSYLSDRSGIRPVQLQGSLGLAGALLEKSRFYVGTDSGLAHLAAAVGRRAITLFAPADPDRVCPFGQRDLVIQPEGLEKPSFLYPWESTKPRIRPGHVQDIQRITVEQVMSKVRQVVSAQSSSVSETGRP